MTTDAKTLAYWIETILNEGRNLSKWERDFTESVSEQLEQRGALSERQIEILERIYTEKTP